MLESWKERRIRNSLAKRELLLRLEAKRLGAPGKSGPPTEYFRRQKRNLLLSNPRFAITYLRVTKHDRTRAHRRAENQDAYQQYMRLLQLDAESAPRRSESRQQSSPH